MFRDISDFGLQAKAGVLAGLAILAAAAPANGLNWEGHDDWVADITLFEALTDGVPLPKLVPVPKCSEMEKSLEANSYEQIPLPGLNCVEGEDDELD